MSLGPEIRLAEYSRVEGARTKAAGIDKGLKKLVVQEPKLPIDGQGCLAKGIEVAEFEFFSWHFKVDGVAPPPIFPGVWRPVALRGPVALPTNLTREEVPSEVRTPADSSTATNANRCDHL